MIAADGLILAGGKNSRMGGKYKGELHYHENTFVDNLIQEFRKETFHIWISYGDTVQKKYEGCQIVRDIYRNCGPLGGIHAGLTHCENNLLMVGACDMPLLKIDFYQFLMKNWIQDDHFEHFMGVVPICAGRVHPLAAIYKKEACTLLEEQLQRGNYRVRDALNRIPTLYVNISGQEKYETMLQNVNTPQEYEKIIQNTESSFPDAKTVQRHNKVFQSSENPVKSKKMISRKTDSPQKPCVIAVCGLKNSGKTTLLEKIIHHLTAQGIKTAVIKHDGHDFSCDIPGTDSYRLHEAGAYGTAVFSKNRIFLHKEHTEAGKENTQSEKSNSLDNHNNIEKELLSFFPEADVIMVEGLKNSTYPKIEIVRKDISDHPVSNPDGRFLVVTDYDTDHFAEDTVHFSEIDRITEKIVEIIKEKKEKEY